MFYKRCRQITVFRYSDATQSLLIWEKNNPTGHDLQSAIALLNILDFLKLNSIKEVIIIRRLMYSSIAINHTIAKSINSSNQNSRITLFDNTPPITISNPLSVNGFLKNLKGYSNIVSLPEAGLPDIQLEDTDQTRLIKAMNIEWESFRIQLDLEISPDGINFIKIGAISLINQMGYPFRNYSLLDFFTDGLAAEFGTNGKIACQVKDVGYGKLGTNDELTIYGNVSQEIVFNSSFEITNSSLENTVNIFAETSTLILGSDTLRKGITLFNGSDETIYIGYSNNVNNANYSLRLSSGKGYEFPYPVYTGLIFAYSLQPTTLQVAEFYYVPQSNN